MTINHNSFGSKLKNINISVAKGSVPHMHHPSVQYDGCGERDLGIDAMSTQHMLSTSSERFSFGTRSWLPVSSLPTSMRSKDRPDYF